jgi:putative heme-binding domain-containing protein
MHSGNTYRFRPAGAHLEQFTWGQVNPFGMCLDPWGNLYTADCHSQPIYQLLRGGYYPSFAKGHDGLGFAPEMYTGYKGSTAIAGIALYAADAFPERYRKSAFIGDVMTNQIVEFRLAWHGSTPRAKDAVFLDSADPWFRPVDVKLGPDGALYVADFYNRIIGHYEVPLDHPGRDRHRGRIWRIAYTGNDNKGTPAPRQDWTKASVDELVSDLHHPNLTVRMLATGQLAHRGGKEVSDATRAAFRDKISISHKAESDSHALWVLERLGALDDDTLKAACGHGDALVRNHAQRILAGRKTLTPPQHSWVLAGLSDENANVQRAAADALGQHPDPANLRPLLDLRHRVPAADTHLLHVVRMALRNQLLPADNWKSVAAGTWSKQDRQALADVALGVHSADAAHFLLGQIKAQPYPGGALAEFVHHIARHAPAGDLDALTAFCGDNEPRNLLHQAALVRAVQRGTQERSAALSADAHAWGAKVVEALLTAKDDGKVQQGIELTGVLRLEAQQDRLIGLALGKTPPPLRKAALNALAAIDARKHAVTLGKVVAEAAMPLEARQHAAGLLARANQPETRAQLLVALPVAPARLQTSIAEGLASSKEGGEKLLELVASGKASARLLQERSVTVRLGASRVPGLKERLEKLTAGLPAADAKLQELISQRRRGYLKAKGDPVKGAAIYEKSCAICHQIGGKGAKIGPQLDGIGLRGLDRLLEDTLDPNRNVDQAFRMTSLTLKKGQLVQGLVLREEGAVLVLADQEGKEVRVPSKDVEERTVSQMSPMPADVAIKMSDADFYNLMAYLLAQKPVK